MRVLVLGGTAEARAVAARLVERGDDVVSSLAGRASSPALPVGGVHVGGFGGIAGLRDFVVAQRFSAVVDATHPFAARIPAHATAAVAGELGSRPFLTTGRQQLDAFASWTDRYVLARVVDPPAWALPSTWEVLRARGPFTVDAELALMGGGDIHVLVTKDSGGSLTEAKLEAAHALGIAVVVVRRPHEPAGATVVDSVDDAVAALDALTGPVSP